MSLYCRIYDVSLKLVLIAELVLDKTSLTIKHQVLQLTSQLTSCGFNTIIFPNTTKAMTLKTFIKIVYIFASIMKALTYAVIIAIVR